MMNTIQAAAYGAGLLFLAIVAALEGGRRLGARQVARDPEKARPGLGAIEGAVFGLLGLLVAFTFSGAASRFETRKTLVVEEANAIGTAWLRLDLLPASTQPALRDLFRSYVDARLEIYQSLPDVQAAKAAAIRAQNLQGQVWAQAVAACDSSSKVAPATLLLPALNAMFDITTTRHAAAMHGHPPMVIYAMLVGVSLICAVLAGFAMAGAKRRSWIHLIGFALIMAITVYVILDLEYPRAGFVRVDRIDQLLVTLRESMR